MWTILMWTIRDALKENQITLAIARSGDALVRTARRNAPAARRG